MKKREADDMKRQKQEIAAQATKVVMEEISSRLLAKINKADLEIRIKARRNNRYIAFHEYGADLKVLIYQSGDVDFVCKELSHLEVTIRVIHYEDALKDKDIMERFRKDVELMISCYLNNNWHEFMDYMCHMEEGSDWRETVNMFMKENG